MNWKKTGTAVITVAIFAGVGFAAWKITGGMFEKKTNLEYITQPVVMGVMQRTIAATGTVEPEELVNVGAQVGGMITTLGVDTDGKQVDYRSTVKKGEILANIDDSLYRAEFDAAKAQVLQAKAQLKSAEANVTQAKAKLAEAEASRQQTDAQFKLAGLNWERAKQLKKVNSKSEFDTAEASYANAQAAVSLAEASIQSARAALATAEASRVQAYAQIASANANLEKAERNLGYCVINSPVDGVIIDRRVNIGQTVNSSMNAPSLFLIAKDLKKMEVWVSVNEADIGQIKVGQKAVFTVDAFRNREFTGEVRKVRLNATMSQNVVTYVVEIATDNSDLTLLPYLTANVKFILDERKNATAVPNAALRFLPPAESGISIPETAPGERLVWYLDQSGKPAPIKVRTGLNDGMNTEIISAEKEITADFHLITGSHIVQEDKAKNTKGENPFMAKPPARNRKPAGQAQGQGAPPAPAK